MLEQGQGSVAGRVKRGDLDQDTQGRALYLPGGSPGAGVTEGKGREAGRSFCAGEGNERNGNRTAGCEARDVPGALRGARGSPSPGGGPRAGVGGGEGGGPQARAGAGGSAAPRPRPAPPRRHFAGGCGGDRRRRRQLVLRRRGAAAGQEPRELQPGESRAATSPARPAGRTCRPSREVPAAPTRPAWHGPRALSPTGPAARPARPHPDPSPGTPRLPATLAQGHEMPGGP
ncbi:hypothetical protein P7K49_009381 [Saguinus oedipus]|uniref:Uncharacterized protein n=1 Tax=Saguinus oedipus TaxID=9490 RepID=A0ABQ9VKK4_SAGOE|nr:hypothetical protein P7K49_009381 [Saguinus oedipus]